MGWVVVLNVMCALVNWTFVVLELGNGAWLRAVISFIVAMFNAGVAVRLWMEVD